MTTNATNKTSVFVAFACDLWICVLFLQKRKNKTRHTYKECSCNKGHNTVNSHVGKEPIHSPQNCGINQGVGKTKSDNGKREGNDFQYRPQYGISRGKQKPGCAQYTPVGRNCKAVYNLRGDINRPRI